MKRSISVLTVVAAMSCLVLASPRQVFGAEYGIPSELEWDFGDGGEQHHTPGGNYYMHKMRVAESNGSSDETVIRLANAASNAYNTQGCRLVFDYYGTELLGMADARPDTENYSLTATVPAVSFVPLDPNGGALAVAINEKMMAEGHIIDNLRLLNMGLERYYGALSMGATADAFMQRDCAVQALGSLDDNLSAYCSSLTTVYSLLQDTDAGDYILTATDLVATCDAILTDGFPEGELQFISEAGMTTAEIDGMLRQMADATGASVPEGGLTDGQVTARMVEFYNQDVAGLVPDSFPIPEPATLSLLALGGLALLRRRK